MNIQEAVKKAIAEKACISRSEYRHVIEIQPLPTKEKFRAIHISGNTVDNWRPTVKDLLANDWYVTN